MPHISIINVHIFFRGKFKHFSSLEYTERGAFTLHIEKCHPFFSLKNMLNILFNQFWITIKKSNHLAFFFLFVLYWRRKFHVLWGMYVEGAYLRKKCKHKKLGIWLLKFNAPIVAVFKLKWWWHLELNCYMHFLFLHKGSWRGGIPARVKILSQIRKKKKKKWIRVGGSWKV